MRIIFFARPVEYFFVSAVLIRKQEKVYKVKPLLARCLFKENQSFGRVTFEECYVEENGSAQLLPDGFFGEEATIEGVEYDSEAPEGYCFDILSARVDGKPLWMNKTRSAADLRIKSSWGPEREYVVLPYGNTYTQGGRIRLGLYSLVEECNYWEPYCNITVNIPDSPLTNETTCGYVDVASCPEIENFLVLNGLGQPTGMDAKGDWTKWPEYEFNLDRLRAYM